MRFEFALVTISLALLCGSISFSFYFIGSICFQIQTTNFILIFQTIRCHFSLQGVGNPWNFQLI